MMAGRRDYLCRRWHQVLEEAGLNRGWFRELAAHLKSGGALHVNFIHAPGGENLVESPRQRAEAIAWMDANLRGAIPLRVDAPSQIYARYDNPR